MNMFEKFILTRAEKIKKKEAEKQAKIQEAHDKAYKERKRIRSLAREQIFKGLEDFAKTLQLPDFIQVGDRAILNIYELKYSGANGWDGGPMCLMRRLKESETATPIWVKIKAVFLDKTYAHERVDYFLDDQEHQLSIYTENDSTWKKFKDWCETKSNSYWKDTFGMYWSATFDLEEISLTNTLKQNGIDSFYSSRTSSWYFYRL